jgi:hypothetical protein
MSLMLNVLDMAREVGGFKKCDVITTETLTDGSNIEIFASHMKSPSSMVDDRVVFDAKYIWP